MSLKQELWPEVAPENLEPPDQPDRRLGQVGEIVAGQARELEIRDLVKQAAVFRSKGQILADIEIDSTAVNKRGLGLIVAGVVADADKRVSQRIGGTKEERANTSQRIWTNSAPGRRADHRFTRELMNVGLDVRL